MLLTQTLYHNSLKSHLLSTMARVLIVVAELAVQARASYCQMPRNRHGPTPQALLVASLVYITSLIYARDKSAASRDVRDSQLPGSPICRATRMPIPLKPIQPAQRGPGWQLTPPDATGNCLAWQNWSQCSVRRPRRPALSHRVPPH